MKKYLEKLKNFWEKVLLRGIRAAFRHEKWEIGIVDAPIEKFLDPNFYPKIRWLSGLSRNEFRADPFGRQKDGRLEIYCEHFNYFRWKGYLEKLKLCEKMGVMEEETILELPFHASYPFIFEHKGKTYLIPETHQKNSVDLYSLDEKENKWEKVETLIADFPGVDPTVLFDGKYFWLFLTNEKKGSDDELYLYYSEKLENGWVEHSKNPVKIGKYGTRPAGTPFFHEGFWYRPAQDCSDFYGRGVVINKIEKLDPDVFLEKEVQKIYPKKDSDFPDGIHTLSSVGNLTLIDGKKTVFSPGGFIRFFMRNIDRSVGYLTGKIYQKIIMKMFKKYFGQRGKHSV